MPDVTVKSIDDMEAIYEASRAPRALSSASRLLEWVFTPTALGRLPEPQSQHRRFDPNQEEVYIPLSGGATLVADGAEFELRPGTMARVGPDQLRQIRPGAEGIRFVAIGGAPGAFTAAPGPSSARIHRARRPSSVRCGDGRAGVRASDRATGGRSTTATGCSARCTTQRTRCRRRCCARGRARPLRAARPAHHVAPYHCHQRLPHGHRA